MVERLLGSHREFLAFLEARLHDRALAEEILQAAFVRAIDRAESIRAPENSVAWFYRLLRNALVDHYRKRSAEARALAQSEAESTQVSEPELKGVLCSCLNRLLPTLEPSHEHILRRVDFDDASLETVAEELGITRNNATVRLHRARQSLKRALVKCCGSCTRHGCLDCTCGAVSP